MNILKNGTLSALFLCLWLQPARAADDHSRHQHATSSDGANPLIEEMVKLDTVFHEIVSGVALDDAGRVRKAVESMHGSMEKTHEGMHHGSVRIPKNAGRVEDFVRQDKEFHAGLEKLAAAAGRNDRDGMLRLTKDLLDRCVVCHRDFRNR